MALSKESDMFTKMREEMYQLLKNNQFTDVTIETADRKLHAHKVILWSVPSQIRSSFNDRKIVLRNWTGDDIEKIIKFIYTEEIDIQQTKDAIKFCKLSIELCLQYLEDLTVENLLKKIKNIDDCLDIWRFAEEAQKNNLLKPCLATIMIDFKKFMMNSIRKLTDKEMKSLLNKSKLSDFDNYEIIKEWGALEKNSKDRKYYVEKLFERFVDWSNIENENFPKIASDQYMLTNFKDIISTDLVYDRLPKESSTSNVTKLHRQVLNWDSYPESD